LYQLEDFDAFVLDKKPKKYKKETPVAPKGVHIVKKGETLYSISKLYDLEVEELIEMNDLSSNEIEINQGLIIYSSKKDKSSKPQKEVNREIAFRKGWHTVQKGETLYSISKLYDMTPQGLADINDLNSNELSVGQELKVNERISESDSFHQVKKGDTLYSISKKYSLTVDELKRLNQLSSNTISIGQKLRIN
jgi:LysM repeat protein